MKKDYYLLETDSYGQPNGIIVTISLEKEQYEKMKKEGAYIYKDYETAYYRAID